MTSARVKWAWLQLQLINEKSAQRHKHCALAVVRQNQNFSLCRTRPSHGAGQPKFNPLEKVTKFGENR